MPCTINGEQMIGVDAYDTLLCVVCAAAHS